MTQIVFDLDVLDRFAERLGGWPVPVLAGIFPVTSYRLALRLHNEVPGIVVPERLQGALDEAGPGAASVGMAHARALLADARERCDGVYVVAPYRKPTLGARAARVARGRLSGRAASASEVKRFCRSRMSCGGATLSRRCSTSDWRTARRTFG